MEEDEREALRRELSTAVMFPSSVRLVAQLPQPTRPVLRAAVRIHRNQARSTIGEVIEELRPPQLQGHALSRLQLDPVELKRAFRRIHPDDRFAILLHWTLRLAREETMSSH